MTENKAKWVMHNYNHFSIEENGYVAELKLGGFYPSWIIYKDGEMVDAAPYHSPVTSDCNKELAAKAYIEKRLSQLKINQ